MLEEIHALSIKRKESLLEFVYESPGGRREVERSFGERVARELAQDIWTALNEPSETADWGKLRDLGTKLRDAVMHEEVAARLRMLPRGTGLRLHLPEDLDWVPWELIWDGNEFLCTRFRLGRLLPKGGEELDAVTKGLSQKRKREHEGLRALVAVGDTETLESSATEQEAVRTELEKRCVFANSFGGALDSQDLFQQLKEHDLVHFVGHGVYDESDPAKSGWRCAGGDVLECRFIEETPKLERFPFLIFANACDSAHPSLSASEHYVGRVHRAFLRKGVPHYIGALVKLADKESADFAELFYAELARGVTIGEALGNARLTFYERPGHPIWALYVHYGEPDAEVFPRVRVTSKSPLRTAPLIVSVLAGLLALLWFLRPLILPPFPKSMFGVAAAPLLVKDVAGGEHGRPEPMITQQQLENAIAELLPKNEFKVRVIEAPFRSHDEARQWGTEKRAAIVLWGTGDRGTTAATIHLSGTRVATSERDHDAETYKRFFLRMLFKDVFRDDQTYTTDFDLSEISVDLAKPEGMRLLHRQAGLLASLLRGIDLYTLGAYGQAAELFEKIAASNESQQLAVTAQRWLVLSRLNNKEYDAALRAFTKLLDEGPISDDDLVRLGFLRRCEALIGRGRRASAESTWKEPIEKALESEHLSPGLRGVGATLLAEGQLGLPARNLAVLAAYQPTKPSVEPFLTEMLRKVAKLELLIESAASQAPESYFLQYLLAMVTTRPAIAEKALADAERLNPRAAEPHFGRAKLLWQGPTKDWEGAIKELTKAIMADPSIVGYWHEKELLLQNRTRDAVGSAKTSERHRYVSFAEEFLKASQAPRDTRIRLLEELARAHYALQQSDQALATLKRAAQELPGDVEVCKFSAAMAMRELTAFEDAEKFLQCVARSTGALDFELEELFLELTWRRGQFDEAIRGYGEGPLLKERWKKDAAESVAVLDIIGNILHSAGRYADAESVLRLAKRRALETTPTDRDYVAGSGPFSFQIREDDWKWWWATSFDLGLLLLDKGDYAGAAREFEEAIQFVRRFRSRFTHFKDARSLYMNQGEIILLSRLCQGYALFKNREYEAAANSWWAATYHMRFIRLSEHQLQDILAQSYSELQKYPYDYSHSKRTTVFELLIRFERYKEAGDFIEKNALHLDDRGPEWTANLLFTYMSEKRFEDANSLFLSFARKNGASPRFRSPISGLNTTLYKGWFEPRITANRADYFWDVIARNPRQQP